MSRAVLGARTHAHESEFFQSVHALFFSDEFLGSHGFSFRPRPMLITGCGRRAMGCCGGMGCCAILGLGAVGPAEPFSTGTARPLAVRLVIF